MAEFRSTASDEATEISCPILQQDLRFGQRNDWAQRKVPIPDPDLVQEDLRFGQRNESFQLHTWIWHLIKQQHLVVQEDLRFGQRNARQVSNSRPGGFSPRGSMPDEFKPQTPGKNIWRISSVKYKAFPPWPGPHSYALNDGAAENIPTSYIREWTVDWRFGKLKLSSAMN